MPFYLLDFDNQLSVTVTANIRLNIEKVFFPAKVPTEEEELSEGAEAGTVRKSAVSPEYDAAITTGSIVESTHPPEPSEVIPATEKVRESFPSTASMVITSEEEVEEPTPATTTEIMTTTSATTLAPTVEEEGEILGSEIILPSVVAPEEVVETKVRSCCFRLFRLAMLTKPGKCASN